MNNSTVDRESLVQQMNDEKAHLLIPATVYVCVLMITGIIGNLMVCFYYQFKTKPVPTSIFIVTLSVYDLIVCFISMPTEIVDIVRFYTFTNGPACKFLRFVNYLAGIGSILTLIMIAVDRYRHICHAMGIQMTVKHAKIYCLVVAGLALVLSWPSLVIYDAVIVPIPNTYGLSLEGSDCTSNKDKSYKPYVWAFNGVHFILFFICSAALIVLYSIVGRTIYRHRKRIAKYKETAPTARISAVDKTDPDISMSTDSSTDKTHEGDQELSESSAKSPIHKTIEQENPTPNQPKSNNKIQDKSNTRRFDRETIRMTFLMFIVTALFIVSFLPYLSLTVWRIVEGKHEAEFLSDAGLVAFKIGSRSFLLNSSLNPWIYGVFNSKFRQYYYNLFCCKPK